MAKKQYAPLVSQEKYVYEKNKNPFFRESIRRISDTCREYVSAVYCPKCGHLHIIDGRRYRNGHYLRKFLCPECGYYKDMYQEGSWITPETAMVFKMADGSIAVSLIIKKHTLLVAKDLKTPIYHEKLMRIRYVFNANGHTYYKDPVYIKSGRPVPMYSGTKPNIKPITYMASNEAWNTHIMFPRFNEFMVKLVDLGYIPEDYIRRNRFHNVSNKILDEIYTLLSMFHRQQSSFGRRIAKVIREIDKNATDEDVIRLLIKRANMKNGGKKFRRSMATDPVRTFVGSLMFRKLQLTDINYFDIVKKLSPTLFETESYITLINIIRKKYGEKAIVNALQKYCMLSDSVRYINMLSEIIPVAELENLVYYNIRNTHDALLHMYQEVQEQIECRHGIASVIQKCRDIETGKVKPEYMSIAKKQVIYKAEEAINNQIAYGKQEKELEETINNIQFYLPPDTDHLKMAGDKLHNCVGHLYRMPAYRKESIIVLMKQADKFVGCIEISNGKIKQAYGPCNQIFNTSAQEAFDRWAKKHKLSETTTNTGLTDIKKEYIMPKYNDIITTIKKISANITIPIAPPRIARALPF